MRPLTAIELLAIWEQGLTASPPQRALLLLAAACPESSVEALLQLSIGQRDGQLLTLREWLFGSEFAGLTACPQCSEKLDMTFTTDDIRNGVEPQDSTPLCLNLANREVRFRLPTSADVLALADWRDPELAQQALLSRCLVGSEAASVSNLSPETVVAISARMAEADPQADVRLSLTCPACSHRWQALFDIVAFFWKEINHWANRILREVHLLASTYGWSEADILALTPTRRQWYLALVDG